MAHRRDRAHRVDVVELDVRIGVRGDFVIALIALDDSARQVETIAQVNKLQPSLPVYVVRDVSRSVKVIVDTSRSRTPSIGSTCTIESALPLNDSARSASSGLLALVQRMLAPRVLEPAW